MPRPKSKDALLKAMSQDYEALEILLKQFTPDEKVQSGVCEVWSIKDILAHLYAWQQMVISWYHAGVRGDAFKTPADDLKWSETPLLNQRIYEQYRDVPLADIAAQFAASHSEAYALLQSIPEDALITPKVYTWTNTSTLLSYFVSSTSSHYQWAMSEIKRWAKAQKTAAPSTT